MRTEGSWEVGWQPLRENVCPPTVCEGGREGEREGEGEREEGGKE